MHYTDENYKDGIKIFAQEENCVQVQPDSKAKQSIRRRGRPNHPGSHERQTLMENVIPSISSVLTNVCTHSNSDLFRSAAFSAANVEDSRAFHHAIEKYLWLIAEDSHGVQEPKNKLPTRHQVPRINPFTEYSSTTHCKRRHSTDDIVRPVVADEDPFKRHKASQINTKVNHDKRDDTYVKPVVQSDLESRHLGHFDFLGLNLTHDDKENDHDSGSASTDVVHELDASAIDFLLNGATIN